GPREGGVLVLSPLQEALVVEEQGTRERVAQVGGERRGLVSRPGRAQGGLEVGRLVGPVEEAQEGNEGRRADQHALRVAQGVANEEARVLGIGRGPEVEAPAERRERAHAPSLHWPRRRTPLTVASARNTIESWPP